MDLKLLETLSEIAHVVSEIRCLNHRNQQLVEGLTAIEAERERERQILVSLVTELEARLVGSCSAAA
ncbi:hypothetical protein KX729_32445 [Rhizobium sp. XQZ8]|uniref:hypothetical protein n=1 Tax=Rhizobium populisoli TaxID=2859785 RepID=UPI001CA51141|nr:hypothetical protein [Rhizobium populisoli]MBW6426076.1 hypothetical protein [Rhizobium populisoli]